VDFGVVGSECCHAEVVKSTVTEQTDVFVCQCESSESFDVSLLELKPL
jgi:hypothetical protein